LTKAQFDPRAPAAAILALLLGLAAPAWASRRPATPLPAPALPASYGGEAAGALLAPAALDRWWLLFGDPVLDALEAESLRESPDALTAGARDMEARATRAARRAATFPSGSITGNASRQKAYAIGAPSNDLNPTGGITDSATGDFNVSWELDLFGRLATARRLADADAAEARFNVEGTRASLAAQVAEAYFQVRGLAIQLEDARQTARIRDDLLTVARRRADAGAGPPDDVDRAAGQLAQAEAQADDLAAQRDAARRDLLILVGRDLAAVDDPLAERTLPEVPASPAAIPADLLVRRPDVREAEYRLRAELGSARLAHLAIFPTITLLPGLGLSSTASPGVSYIPPTTLITSQQTTTTGFWTLGAGISTPTLDIPRLLRQAQAEDARAHEAAIAYQGVVRTAFGEARDALDSLAAGERASMRLTAGELRARRAYEATRRRYAQGLDDLTATLSAEMEWRDIRSALTAERVDTLRRAVRTYKALGGGWAFAEAGGGGRS
jgi:NodT family efflux transporter outer membrane factor (OMF) lipoprotein